MKNKKIYQDMLIGYGRGLDIDSREIIAVKGIEFCEEKQEYQKVLIYLRGLQTPFEADCTPEEFHETYKQEIDILNGDM